MAGITLTLKLDVIPGGRDNQGIILVPGQEPPSDSTSMTLLTYMQGKPATAHVKDVLAAIPGSYILSADNWANNIGVRKRWLVLPPYEMNCCTHMVDYYQIIRDVARIEEPEEERYDTCDVFNTGICPAPGWENTPTPQLDPYQTEGSSPYGFINYNAPPPWVTPQPKPTGTYRDEHN